MKKRLINFKKKILLLFLWAISICTYAQNITVTGIISDTEGEPLIGVTIQVQGTTHGTVTDFDGKYSVTDVPSDANLEVSYVGKGLGAKRKCICSTTISVYRSVLQIAELFLVILEKTALFIIALIFLIIFWEIRLF